MAVQDKKVTVNRQTSMRYVLKLLSVEVSDKVWEEEEEERKVSRSALAKVTRCMDDINVRVEGM